MLSAYLASLLRTVPCNSVRLYVCVCMREAQHDRPERVKRYLSYNITVLYYSVVSLNVINDYKTCSDVRVCTSRMEGRAILPSAL